MHTVWRAGYIGASRYHAQQIAWMALKMMGGANKERAHDGNTLQVNYLLYHYVFFFICVTKDLFIL